MYITIPYNYEVGRTIIHNLLFLITQRIAFDFGQVKVNNSLLLCERIPETPEEKNLVGDAPFAAEMHLEEVVAPPIFDAKKFTEQTSIPLDIRLVDQYNSANKALNSIEKFLGFFKIIESLFIPKGKKQFLQKALQSNQILFDIYTKIYKFEEIAEAKISYDTFIKAIVHARHRCAHLRLHKNFGYLPHDPKIKEEIEPFLSLLEIITYHAIRGI